MYCCVLFSLSGWDEGCMTMSQGEIAKLTIPSAKGYGSRGFPAWGYPFKVTKSLLFILGSTCK